MSPGRALVFGATGYVGTHVCTALRNRGHDVVGLARTAPDHDVAGSFVEIDMSREDPSTVAELVDRHRPTVLVNTIGSIWGRSDDQMWSAIVGPVATLVGALRKASHAPWVVHLGSVLEYGTADRGTSSSAPVVAGPPATAYGAAKLAASECILRAVSDGYVDATILRVANVSGPGSPDISLLGQVARQLVEARRAGVPATITLDALTAHRDYVDVRDVAEAVAAATHTRMTGRVVDIGGGTAVSVRDLVMTLIEVSGVETRLIERVGIHNSKRPEWTRVDIGPAETHLGWSPRTSIRQSVEDFWHDTIRVAETSPEEELP